MTSTTRVLVVAELTQLSTTPASVMHTENVAVDYDRIGVSEREASLRQVGFVPLRERITDECGGGGCGSRRLGSSDAASAVGACPQCGSTEVRRMVQTLVEVAGGPAEVREFRRGVAAGGYRDRKVVRTEIVGGSEK